MKTCLLQIAVLTIFGCLFLFSCTISFSNISTHGSAEDLVDQTQAPQNDIKPNLDLQIPIKPL